MTKRRKQLKRWSSKRVGSRGPLARRFSRRGRIAQVRLPKAVRRSGAFGSRRRAPSVSISLRRRGAPAAMAGAGAAARSRLARPSTEPASKGGRGGSPDDEGRQLGARAAAAAAVARGVMAETRGGSSKRRPAALALAAAGAAGGIAVAQRRKGDSGSETDAGAAPQGSTEQVPWPEQVTDAAAEGGAPSASRS